MLTSDSIGTDARAKPYRSGRGGLQQRALDTLADLFDYPTALALLNDELGGS